MVNNKTKRKTSKKESKTIVKEPNHNKLITKNITKTKSGHRLTPKESAFIDKYIELGNGSEAVLQAGYRCKNQAQYAQELLRKQYLADEIEARLQEMKSARIADAKEVMEYFSSVMRGEIRDQFGLDAPLSERTKAAQELAKRTVDLENKVAGKAQAEVVIKLDWGNEDNDTDQ